MEEKERNFKVGDKVRIDFIDAESRRCLECQGKEGIVKSFYTDDRLYVEVEYAKEKGIYCTRFFNEYDLLLIEEAKPTPLTWLQIQERIGKPVWDNETKEWRIICLYKEHAKYGKKLEFTDELSCTYEEDRFYAEEVGE